VGRETGRENPRATFGSYLDHDLNSNGLIRVTGSATGVALCLSVGAMRCKPIPLT